MPKVRESHGLARFEGLELDLRSGELRQKDRTTVALPEQPLRILIALLERPREVVFREEIRKRLWPNDTVVEFEHSISAAMSRLRQALGDSGDEPRYIETLPRRGYRWLVPVEWVEASPTVAPSPLVSKATSYIPGENLMGKKVSHYRILEVLGGGGMGIVYKAEDVRLGRSVAIKFLGEEFTGNHRALERFEREARSISALDHPNICTIYEVEEHEGQPFIVMQLLQGQTLRQRIESAGPGQSAFCQGELINLGIQIAAGLEAAHERRIIHRDVKPANIFVTNRGEIKLLDFGLAKLVGADGLPGASPAGQQHETDQKDSALVRASGSSATLTGAMIGTASYMSPEQVRGERLDVRSDIFSFGVVLYEMATGHQPFRRDEPPAIYDAILNHTPPSPFTLNSDLPARLEPIISKALEKDCEKRYQSASELCVDLKRLQRHLSSGQIGYAPTPAVQDAAAPAATAPSVRGDTTPAAQRTRGGPRQKYFLVAIFAILLMALYAAYHYLPPHKAPSRPAKLSQISHWNKPMNGARLSSDGRMVAFSSPVGMDEQIFVMLTTGGEPLQVTHDEGYKHLDNFSPDGTEVYYASSLGYDQEWAVPTIGGTPRRVVSGCCLAFSPDGGSLFYLKSYSRAVFRSMRSGLEEERVYTFDAPPLLPLSLLPYPSGDDLLVMAVASLSEEQIRLYKVNVPSRTAVALGALSGLVGDIVWAEPGKTLLFSRNVSGLTNLWRYNLMDGELTQVTSDPGPDLSPMPKLGTGEIYYVNGKSSGLLTAYYAHSKGMVEIEPENASQPIISHDRKHVAYIKFVGSRRNELWISNLDGTHKLRLASSESLFTGEWAPDSSRLSFFEDASVGGRGYVVGADGQGLRSIGKFAEPIDWIAWSADGKSLYITTFKNKSERVLWKASADGSSVQRFLDNACTAMDASIDGQYLLGSLLWGEGAGIYQISLRDKTLVPLLPGVATQPTRFAPDNQSFLYAEFSHAGVTLYRQAWHNGKLIDKPKAALRLPFGFNMDFEGNAFDFARDLSEVVYGRGVGQAELYLLSGAR